MVLNCAWESKSWSASLHLFLVVYFSVQQDSLLFDRKEKLIWISPVAVGGRRVNLRILSVPVMIGACSISLGSPRITSDFWNNVVIEGQNWLADLQKSSAELMTIWPDFTIFNCATYPVHGPFAMIGFIIMPINQQIGTVGGISLKDEERPELRCTSVTPRITFVSAICFFFDDEIDTYQRCYTSVTATLIEVFCSYSFNFINVIALSCP